MATHKYNYTLPAIAIHTFPCNSSNAITKQYYDFLVGEINRGTIHKAVCKVDIEAFNYSLYHLISSR